mmetsp:Transcript_62672/g.150698  ORF Transcript_62672/g.150698 Transcript_62672/m.150698 type:complete len:224 (-) Transcript_62672:613-1284(-)
MDGGGVERVIDLKLEEDAAERVVDRGTHASDYKRHPRRDDCTWCSDAHKPGEDSVERDRDGEDVLELVGGEYTDDAAGCSRNGCVYRDLSGQLPRLYKVEHRAAVEAVPPEPKHAHPQRHEGDVVLGHVVDMACHWVEPAEPRPAKIGSHQPRQPPHHVHNPRARKVDQPVRLRVLCVEERAPSLVGGHEAIPPHPMNNYRINEDRHGARRHDVRLDPHPLAD